MGKSKTPNPAQQVINQASTAYQSTTEPSAAENAAAGTTAQFQQNYNDSVGSAKQDYGNIMNAYGDFSKNLQVPHITAQRPEELNESYGYLREAMPGYRDFASTGGYSPTDVQELRARGIAPIRSAYGGTMRQLDQARSLGGDGGSPNYIAARSRAQRELPGQMADAMTTVNADLANAIRQGKMFGLSGMTNTGSTMGGLASADAGRTLQADMSNQNADMQANQMRLASLGGQASLYGTTPGMASMFGNQALQSQQNLNAMTANRQNYGLGLLDAQLRGYGTDKATQGTPWWQTALGVAGTVAPFFSDENMKYDVRPVKGSVNERLKKLPINMWKYKGETTSHLGPMAQAFKKAFGVGDGKTLHPVDIMGVVLASQKEAVAHA